MIIFKNEDYFTIKEKYKKTFDWKETLNINFQIIKGYFDIFCLENYISKMFIIF